ncbi:probable LRR receptor-like serine/threonine-protein kinase At1g05700, partial [Prunus avium]|uniref:non-specific serine/threonine protein kinase n=1 Tax=Prunus avium TaxID=42229 RepID=A0A6P5TR69_PRUAV
SKFAKCFPSTTMWRTLKHFLLFALQLGGFALNLMLLVHCQDDQSGFISIDCGLGKNSRYIEKTTGIHYISDESFIDANESRVVILNDQRDKMQPYWSLRAFPKGTRNCYKINVTRGTKYLIRASFLYGNYDDQYRLPEFQLHLGPNLWDSVKLENVSTVTNKELIHVPPRNYIHVCLVNTNKGVPFVSAIELRTLHNTTYEAHAGSLALDSRYDTGQVSKRVYRYPDDIYDRFWYGYDRDEWTQLNTSSAIDSRDNNDYETPSVVMTTAATPKNVNDSLNIFWLPSDNSAKYHVYMHFSELQKLQVNQSRQLTITWNGELFYGPFAPKYLFVNSIYGLTDWSRGQFITLSISEVGNSTLPPILNAFEIYMVKDFSESLLETNAITNIKSAHNIKRNWQGDPCSPQVYSWEGLNCTYYENAQQPRITSLNLSSSGLTGEISPSISNLTMIQTLDLSNNKLTGSIPEFLSHLPKLAVLKLDKNNFTGSVPKGLIQRRKDGFLSFSCLMGEMMKNFNKNEFLESQGQRFTYSEIVKITNNFASIIGRGGFGKVYLGTLKNEIQVAVKLLGSSRQGSKEFQNEVVLLMSAHHRNLVSLIGYCGEGDTMALVYDYMANGNLEQHISSDVGKNVLTWKERLQIAVDAARGLEYLHNGCKPPIVHRDLKTSNILLNEKLQAKIADFGLSKGLATESVTHVSTAAKGTFGYLDPEYCSTGHLNKKSDIYSFGIVLLELITGRAAIIRDLEQLPIHICQWVRPKFERMEIESIVDSRIQGTYLHSSAQKAIEIAMACVSSTAIQRPDITVVFNDLKECLEIEMPSEITKITEAYESDESDDTISSSGSIIKTSHIRFESNTTRW